MNVSIDNHTYSPSIAVDQKRIAEVKLKAGFIIM